MSEIDIDELGKALEEDFGVEQKSGGRSALEQRVLAGFEEIERLVERHGRVPQHGEDRDIFERLYAVRLDRLRQSTECRAILKNVDRRGLLDVDATASAVDAELDVDSLAESLADLAAPDDVTRLVHVRSPEERKAAEEVAQRQPCADFDTFRPTLEKVQRQLASGERQTTKFESEGKIGRGDLFVLDGHLVLVAGEGETIVKDFNSDVREDRRLRVIFDNGTESNLLMRSLQRALYKDGANRRVLPVGEAEAPLFADTIEEGDLKSGTIYVLRSKSEHPFIAANREAIHKIGVTGGEVHARIANAKRDPTYLLADVDVVAEYQLANINRKRLEELLHRIFAPARLDLAISDRFGSPVGPREWFLVPRHVIDEAIEKIGSGTIGSYRYDTPTARLVLR